MLKKITQSFIKSFRAYEAGEECGHLIREVYVNDRFFVDEEPGALELGIYAEYILSLKLTGVGTLPKDGRVPEPVYSKTGLNQTKYIGKKGELTVANMTSEYQTVHSNIDFLIKKLKELGLVCTGAGVTITKDDTEGTIDFFFKCTKAVKFPDGFEWKKNTIIAVDLKYSGLLTGYMSTKSKHGWAWTTTQKEFHGTQAKQYTHLGEAPFYFLVVQSNNKGVEPIIGFYHVPVSEAMITQHLDEGRALKIKFDNTIKYGFVPRPNAGRCYDCPLKHDCVDAIKTLIVEQVDLNL